MEHHVVAAIDELHSSASNKKYLPWGFLFIVSLCIASTLLAYIYGKSKKEASLPATYEACRIAQGSTIQESYPATCITARGDRFTQPLTEEEKTISSPSRGCTLEAKICPDGSAVGRTGPNCEFDACPSTP